MGEAVERTADGHHIVVNGRRWRATNPHIPEPFRKELVAELLDARRAVKAARADPDALAAVRARVHNAKIALGERGEEWWVEPTDDGQAHRATATILSLLTKRGPSSSICPSDVARVIASPDWRPAMDAVRKAAAALVTQGRIEVTQSGVSIADAAQAVGPVRYVLIPAN